MNSLYGKFGMDDNFLITKILDNDEYLKIENNKNYQIHDVLDLDNKTLVQFKEDNLNTLLDNGNERHNINIAIASAITAYSRIHMSQFKNNPNYKLYYSDTDSIYIDRPLPDSQIGKELGLMKLEATCKKTVFLAPKVYGYITEEGKEIIKIKGLKKPDLNLNELESLLLKDSSKEITQEKWFRSIEESNITIKDQIYTLKVTGNKRLLIYKDNLLIGTEPYTLNKDKEIINI
jgi:hypothetical protein